MQDTAVDTSPVPSNLRTLAAILIGLAGSLIIWVATPYNNFVIGARNNGSFSFDGKIDDVRFYNTALTYTEIKQLLTLSDKEVVPNPADQAAEVNPYVTLNWMPGKNAVLHDIYFGTSFADVNSASIGSPEDMGSQAPNNWSVTNYDPLGLDLDTTYYWRIDEVNDTNTWPGNIWTKVIPT